MSGAHLSRLIQADNNTPRKCLGYLTPAEVYSNHVLHLKCESTPSLTVLEQHKDAKGNFAGIRDVSQDSAPPIARSSARPMAGSDWSSESPV